jgi:phosphonate metabolism protein (transferase hexapeptide repeat family)
MYKIETLNKPSKKILKKEPTIEPSSIIVDSQFGEFVEIGSFNNIQESTIDNYSYTCENCQIIYSYVGKFVNIASYVRINPSPHPMQKASQHHMLYRKEMFGFGQDDSSFFDFRRSRKSHIGHDVWLGHNVVIMGNVTIGNGAVIGSGAIVTKDIPPYAIAVGNPARVIKYRFDEKTIEALEKISWWDWEHEKIKSSLEDFHDINLFIEKHLQG